MATKKRFRVARFLKRDLVVRVNYFDKQSGIVRSSRKLYEFLPAGDGTDGWYETTDEVLYNSLQGLTETLPWSKQTELGLERDGIQYELTFCASCGNNRIKKLQYHLFEFVELQGDD